MTAQTFSTLSIVAYAAAGLCLALAVLFFFLFKIPEVIGDLSGRTAKKNIAKIRSANERSGDKAFTPGRVNEQRATLTKSMRLNNTAAGGVGSDETLPLDAVGSDETTPLDGFGADETTPLDDFGSDETTPLNEPGMEETTPLNESGMEETTPLNEPGMEETTPLDDNGMGAPAAPDDFGETAPLDDFGETAPLTEDELPETAALEQAAAEPEKPAESEETSILTPVEAETELLTDSMPQKTPLEENGWAILESVILIHTEEVIR